MPEVFSREPSHFELSTAGDTAGHDASHRLFEDALSLFKEKDGCHQTGIRGLSPVEFDDTRDVSRIPQAPDRYEEQADRYCRASGREIAKLFDQAYETGDYDLLNDYLTESICTAYRINGLSAVKELGEKINEYTKVEGAAPVIEGLHSCDSFIGHGFNGGTWQYSENLVHFTVTYAEQLSPEQAERAARLSWREQQEEGIFFHPGAGYLRTIRSGPTFTMWATEKENDLIRDREKS
ncbi:MAG: hypothetical protein KC777_24090 [Cyanobacteria bacterium HKST-UBA02]|nr:hypothetical protein [Cyanobacteria bacterium HKST-UBA02]